MLILISLAFLVGPALLCYFFCFPIYRILARLDVVDHPNQRSSHNHPTLRGGGIAIIATVTIGAIVIWVFLREGLLVVLTVSGLVLAIVSFLDDLTLVPPPVRFGCHIAAASSLLWMVERLPIAIELSSTVSFVLPRVLVLLILFLWLVGYTNAFNFMDGINGLAAGQTFVTAVAIALLVGLVSGTWISSPILFSFVIGGSALGFLPHNFPIARMFMGDVSSAPLGFFLATLVLWLARDHGWSLLIPLVLMHANFVLDTSITLARRIFRGDRWYTAHKEHFYQRLVRAGKSHTFVTLSEMGLQSVVLLLMVAYLYVDLPGRVALILSVIGIWLMFFWYCEWQFWQFCARRNGEAKP